jgi:hypothetical protein
MLILIRASFFPAIVQVFRKNLDSDDHFDRPVFVYGGERETTKPKKDYDLTLKKGITMKPLTQFKKISILPVLIEIALVALASPTVARGRGDRLERDRLDGDCDESRAAAASVGAALCDGAGGGI